MAKRNGKVILAKNIKLEKSYKNVLNYTDQQMLELVVTNKVYEANDFSFINRDDRNYVQIDISYSDAIKANYLAYQNPDYGGKWFFAFIDKVEYYSDSSTRIRFTIDEFSTWYGYWDVSTCFVEREHVNDDTVGLHTVPEGLEKGDYIINASGDVETTLNTPTYTVIGVTYVPENTPFYSVNRWYGRVYSGVTYFLFKDDTSVGKFLQAIDDIGQSSSSSVVCITQWPQALTGVTGSYEGWFTGSLGNQTGITACVCPNLIYKTITSNITITSPTTLNGYTPKNNKLFTGEYNSLTISNNCGTQAEYKYEDFINNTPLFDLVGTLTPACSIMLFPKNYKKDSTANSGYNWGIPVGKYPQGSWNNDNYTNWLTQNGINILGIKIDAPTTHAIGGSLEAITGAATQSVEGIGSGLGKMFGAVQEKYRASMIPNTISGQVNSGDITFAYGKISPTYYKMSIRAEYAAIIDEWFTRFGYKVNRLKTPNIVGRTYWNYVKIGASEDIGYANNQYYDVPAPSMEIINTIFRNGTTVWHNHANIGDFTLSNTITS